MAILKMALKKAVFALALEQLFSKQFLSPVPSIIMVILQCEIDDFKPRKTMFWLSTVLRIL